MKLIELDARRAMKLPSHQEVRSKIVAHLAQTLTPEEKKDPNVLLTKARELLAYSSYGGVPEAIKRKVIADVMDAFGITPDESNVSVFMRK